MALTKVTGDFIKAGSITQGHLHSSHGITTSHIAEGDKLFFTNARVDSRVGSLSTSNLSEGSNLYYTDARARGAISVSGNALSYNSSTGVITSNFEESPVFTGNVESQDTFILNYNNAGNKWQQLFDGSNGWNLRYYNGSSWSSNYINVNTSGNATFSGEVTATEYNLPTGGMLDWANGDARIIEGLVNNYSLSFQTWDGSAVSTALRLDGDNTATFAGDLTVSGGDITLGGTGRIQGIDTVSAGTDAANKTYVDNQVAGIVDSAPSTLDTLNELAAALGDDANFSTTVTNSIATKLPLAGGTLTGALNGTTATFSGIGQFAGAIRITENGTAQHILIGNQDSGGVNKPGMIRSANASLEFGYGNSWSGEGGTMTTTLTLHSNSNATFAGTITASGGNSTQWNTAYGWGDHASGGYAADNAVMKLTGNQTISGTKTFSNASIVISGTHGTISFMDTTSGEDNFYLHANSNNFYILADRDGTDTIDGGYETPHPLQLEGDTNTAYVFGSALNIGNWNTAYGWGNHASAGYLTSFDITTQTDGKYLRSNAADGATHRIVFSGCDTNNHDTIATSTGSQGSIEIYNNGSGNDAFMSFHTGGDFALYFGLDADSNKLAVGGWSMGAAKYAIYHEGNKPTLSELGAAASSHNHDDRYYTESEIQQFFDRGYLNSHSATNATVGWYTIATNTGDRALGEFQIWDTASSDHQSVLFSASHHFGMDTSNDITVTANSRYSGTNFRYIRIKEGGTYDGAALQVYIDGSSNTVYAAIVGGNAQESGWVLKDWIPDATDPGDLTSYSSMTERTIVDLDQVINGGMIATGPIYSGGQTAQYRNLTTADQITNNNQLTNGAGYTTYTANQTLNTSSNPTFNDLYLNSWFRNNNSGQGLYNQATTNHWYSDGRYWNVGYSGTTGIRLRNGHAGTILGYLYAETDGQFGLLDKDGHWTFRTNGTTETELRANNIAGLKVNSSGNTHVLGNLTIGNTTSSDLYFTDTDQTTRRMHCNSDRLGFLNSSNSWGAYCSNNGDWTTDFISYAGQSMRTPIFYDSANTAYYGDFASTSNMFQGYYKGKTDGWSLQLGDADLARVYDDDARASLVINAAYYPHLYINANTNNSNTNHGAVFSMTGNISGGGFRRWSIGIPNLDPNMFTIGTYDNQDNPHYGCGGDVLGEGTWGSKLWLDSSSNLQTNGSMRSPIFYDSTDTGYYLHPNSTSVLSLVNHQIGVGVNQSGSQTTRHGVSLYGTYVGGEPTYGIMFTGAGGHLGGHGSVTDGWATFFTMNNNDARGWIFRKVGTGNTSSISAGGIATFDSSVRSPIFYDSGNTAYYADPASLSSMHSLKLIKHQNHTPRWDFSCYVLETPHHYSTNSTNSMYVGESNTIYLRTTAISTGDHRAPIYYDYTNTGYYVNPDSTSNLNAATFAGNVVGQNAYFNQDVGIGFTSGNIGGRLNIRNSAAGQIAAKIELGSSTNSSTIGAFIHTGASYAGSGMFLNFQSNHISGDDNVLICYLDGDLVNKNNSYTQYSDEKLKENIVDATSKLDEIKQIKVRNFNFKGEDLKQIGVVAQELEPIFPALVKEREVPGHEEPIKTVKYSVLVPILIKAMQEQQTIIDDLKSRLETLENQ